MKTGAIKTTLQGATTYRGFVRVPTGNKNYTIYSRVHCVHRDSAIKDALEMKKDLELGLQP